MRRGLAAALLLAGIANADESLKRAIERFDAGDYRGAQTLLEDAQKRAPDDAETLYYLGRTEHRRGAWKAAVGHLQRAVERVPANAEYQFRLGLSLSRYIETVGVLGKPGVAERIRDSLSKAVALNPDFIDARDALLKYDLAAPGFLGGSVAKAREQAAEIARRSAVDGHIANAEIAANLAQNEAAVAEYRAALMLAPKNRDASSELGELYRQLGRFDEAFELFRQALRDDPENQSAYYEIGNTAVASGLRLGEGVEALRRYLRYTPKTDDDPPLAMAHLQLGRLCEKLQRKDAARAEYQAALILDPGMEDARAALSGLN